MPHAHGGSRQPWCVRVAHYSAYEPVAHGVWPTPSPEKHLIGKSFSTSLHTQKRGILTFSMNRGMSPERCTPDLGPTTMIWKPFTFSWGLLILLFDLELGTSYTLIEPGSKAHTEPLEILSSGSYVCVCPLTGFFCKKNLILGGEVYFLFFDSSLALRQGRSSRPGSWGLPGTSVPQPRLISHSCPRLRASSQTKSLRSSAPSRFPPHLHVCPSALCALPSYPTG